MAHDTIAGRVGPTSTYISWGAGCAGTMPASRLVPSDTPRIDDTITIRLFDLPVDVALMITGFDTNTSTLGPLPFDAGVLGMVGCTLYTSDDVISIVSGANNQAVFDLIIPDNPALVGVEFHQQAVVFDPGANPLMFVLSDAATGVIGRK